MIQFFELLSWLALLGGAALVLVGATGLVRLPDFYTRMHGAGVVDTLGAGLVLVGLGLQAGLSLVTVKLAVLLGLVLFTSPVATHALARAARHGGLAPWTRGANEEEPSSKP